MTETTTTRSQEYIINHIKLRCRVYGARAGSKDGQDRYGPRTELELVDTRTGDSKVLDADTWTGVKSQKTWFLKDRQENGMDVHFSGTNFDELAEGLKEQAVEAWKEEAGEPDNEMFDWYEDEEDVDVELVAELEMNGWDFREFYHFEGESLEVTTEVKA